MDHTSDPVWQILCTYKGFVPGHLELGKIPNVGKAGDTSVTLKIGPAVWERTAERNCFWLAEVVAPRDHNLCCYFAIKIPHLRAQLMEGKTSPGIQHSESTHSSPIPRLYPSIPDCSDTVTMLIDSLCSLSHIVHNFT